MICYTQSFICSVSDWVVIKYMLMFCYVTQTFKSGYRHFLSFLCLSWKWKTWMKDEKNIFRLFFESVVLNGLDFKFNFHLDIHISIIGHIVDTDDKIFKKTDFFISTLAVICTLCKVASCELHKITKLGIIQWLKSYVVSLVLSC